MDRPYVIYYLHGSIDFAPDNQFGGVALLQRIFLVRPNLTFARKVMKCNVENRFLSVLVAKSITKPFRVRITALLTETTYPPIRLPLEFCLYILMVF